MAPRQTSPASATNAAAPPAVGQPTAEWRCKVCGKGFRSNQALSGHYNAHINADPDDLEKLPRKSKVLKRSLNTKFKELENKYKEEGWARARAQASGSGLTNLTQQLQGLVSSGRAAAAAAPGPKFPEVGPRAHFGGPVVKKRDFGASSAGSSNIAPRPQLRETGQKGKVQEQGDPNSPNYWKLTGPVTRVQGPGGLLIYKADVGTANGSGKGAGIKI